MINTTYITKTTLLCFYLPFWMQCFNENNSELRKNFLGSEGDNASLRIARLPSETIFFNCHIDGVSFMRALFGHKKNYDADLFFKKAQNWGVGQFESYFKGICNKFDKQKKIFSLYPLYKISNFRNFACNYPIALQIGESAYQMIVDQGLLDFEVSQLNEFQLAQIACGLHRFLNQAYDQQKIGLDQRKNANYGTRYLPGFNATCPRTGYRYAPLDYNVVRPESSFSKQEREALRQIKITSLCFDQDFFSLSFQPLIAKRNYFLRRSNNFAAFYESYSISNEVRDLFNLYDIKPDGHERLWGQPVQHVLHQEALDIFSSAYARRKSFLYKHAGCLVDFIVRGADLSSELNRSGNINQAAWLLTACWHMLECLHCADTILLKTMSNCTKGIQQGFIDAGQLTAKTIFSSIESTVQAFETLPQALIGVGQALFETMQSGGCFLFLSKNDLDAWHYFSSIARSPKTLKKLTKKIDIRSVSRYATSTSVAPFLIVKLCRLIHDLSKIAATLGNKVWEKTKKKIIKYRSDFSSCLGLSSAVVDELINNIILRAQAIDTQSETRNVHENHDDKDTNFDRLILKNQFGDMIPEFDQLYNYLFFPAITYDKKDKTKIPKITGMYHDNKHLFERIGLIALPDKISLCCDFYCADIYFKNGFDAQRIFFPSEWSRYDILKLIIDIADHIDGQKKQDHYYHPFCQNIFIELMFNERGNCIAARPLFAS